MPALSHEERAILALESDVVAGHTVKVVAVQPAVGADALRARLAERLDATPLLRRRLAGEEWEDGAEPDLAVHVAAVDEGGSVPEVVAGLFAGRLDRSRPLWDVHVIDAGDDHSWIVWRIHHALADGTTAMRILEAA